MFSFSPRLLHVFLQQPMHTAVSMHSMHTDLAADQLTIHEKSSGSGIRN